MADSDFKRWLDAAWTDWIQPLGLLVVAGVAYLLYSNDLLGERAAGLALVVAVVFGTLGMGVVPALPLARRTSHRTMLWVMAALALGGAAWPSLRAAWSPQPVATAVLQPGALQATLTGNGNGPWELLVSGKLKQTGASEGEASYNVDVEGNGKEVVSGEIKRALHRFRTSRRGGTSTSLEERNESIHRLQQISGSTVTVRTDAVDEQLESGLQIGIRPAGPRREIFWTLCALAVLLALFLDAALAKDIAEDERKVRGPKREVTYLTIVTGMLLVFTINFGLEATPHTLVRSAIGAFVLALLVGGAGGWLLGAFARLATRPKRR